MAEEDELVFEKAIAISNADQRLAFLEDACQDNVTACENLKRLVASYFAAGPFMCQPATGLIESEPNESSLGGSRFEESIGDRVGHYVLVDVLGRGGMAIVYRALQNEPIEREVALKIIRPGQESEQSIARMELERQALAVMDHRCIAKLFDAGITDWGHPYYAMELVDGEVITAFCRTAQLNMDQRIRLVVDVCGAVEHAHRKGIIHRDIKPSNILVSKTEDVCEVKVIDFGIAKHVSPDRFGGQTLTELGQLVGTPQYMSPEQASLDQNSIDTRSDIYSIGAVLYELLTGQTPFPSASILDTLNRIQAAEPTAPSRIIRGLSADLNAICLKCLEKDPNDRYPSARELELDLKRHLSGLPVQARRTSAAARLVRWAKRSPMAASLSGLSAVALIALLAVWATFTYELKQQRDEIVATAEKLDLERNHAQENFERAHRAIQESLSIRSHTPLGSSDTLLFQKHLLKTGIDFYDELLREDEHGSALSAAPGELASAQLERARLYFEYGKVLLSAHENTSALQAFSSAISLAGELKKNADTELQVDAIRLQGVVSTSVVQAYRRLGAYPEALEAAQRGRTCYQELVGKGELDGDYKNWYLALSWIRIGQVHVEMSKRQEAMRAFEMSLEYCRQLSNVYDFQLTHSNVLLELAQIFRQEGKTDQALATIDQALEIARDICVRSTPPLERYQLARIKCLRERARCLGDARRPQELQDAYREAIQFQEMLLASHPDSEQFVLGLAELYDEMAAAISTGEASAAMVAKAEALRKSLDLRTLRPQRLLLTARMRLDSAAYDLHQLSYTSAARQFSEALALLARLPDDYMADVVAELRTGGHYRLATAYFNATEYALALQHFQHYDDATDSRSEDFRTGLAICYGEIGDSKSALRTVQGISNEFPNTNEMVSYLPVVSMLDLSFRKNVEVARWAEVDAEFRAIAKWKSAMSGPQLQYNALALCRAVEIIESSKDLKVFAPEFIDWAKQEAILSLDLFVQRSGQPLMSGLANDPRIASVAEEPGFLPLTKDR